MTFFLPPIRHSKSCERCDSRYPIEDDSCPHCHGLTERELLQLKGEIEVRKQSRRALGHRMYLIAAIVAIFTLMLLLKAK